MAKECLACGKSMGAFTGKVAIADGHVCVDCWGKAGMENTVNAMMSGNLYNSATIKEMIAVRERKQRFTRGYKRYKETSGLIEWKKYQIFHSIFT